MSSYFDAIKKSSRSESDIFDITFNLIQSSSWIELTSKKDISRISTFLCQVQNFEALKQLLLCCLKKPEKIPGDALLYFISHHSTLNLNNSVFMELHKHEPYFKNYLCPFAIRPEFYELSLKEQYNTYLKKYLKTKEELVDKLQFARSQRLEVEVKKTLEKLIEAFPDDPSFIEEKGKYFEKEAARVIDKSNRSLVNEKNKSNSYDSQRRTPLFNAEEVLNAIQSYFNEDQKEYLMEVFLLAGEEDVVIQILDQQKILKEKYFWIYTELLISKRRYIEALSQVKESNKTETADDQFNYYYFSAICLWNLNDKANALEIIQSIAKVKPNFKQTIFFLNLWQRHSEVA